MCSTRLRQLILSLFLLSSLLAANPKHVFACSCISRGTPLEALESSTAVFAGKVVGIDIPGPVGGRISSIDPVTATVQVAQVWKGPEYKTLIVHTVLDGPSCGYEFGLGGEYLVYARGTEANLQTGLCSRTKLLSAAGEDLKALGEGVIPIMENPSGPNIVQGYSIIGYLGLTGVEAFAIVVLGLTVVGAVAILVVVVRRRLSR